MFHDLLQKEGIRHVVIPVAGMTRESLVVYETSTGQQYAFSPSSVPCEELMGMMARLFREEDMRF
jgi:fructose-1-phosphate kinase PfkB-like protein